MKKFLFILCIIAAVSCGKDDPVNPEYVLFRKLSKGKGIWEVKKIEQYTYDAQGNETLASTATPEQQYIFYVKSEYVNGLIISYNAVTVAEKGLGGITYGIYAEKERVIFHPVGDNLNANFVFNVIENKRNSQLWSTNVSDSTKTLIYLDKCNSCDPYYP